ncbi:hypothetical protein DFA_00732 [Cavenderia fasciculata]|uniref:LRAT domain-containing protein n=1 Tax=Cavenderia fasciculata TaxID=261658 RepID=F4PTI5_CACFS|nr:uncharacterized protein DFA_00732 [Cavenderia fasciculata]EGG20867.1 hypothetical protein DFA_00732 [Cavenderia fasciculata]|eukprot:XP_004358717.1 hypothetical protein DFA_00732 [Cavenderia fasciculata]
MRSSQFTDLFDLYLERDGCLTESDCRGFEMEHIYIKRNLPYGGFYTHHGVRLFYEDNFFTIIHFNGMSDDMSLQSKVGATVLMVGANYEFSKPSPVEEIQVRGNRVSSADSMNRLIKTYKEREQIIYHLLCRNCEHLASFIVDGRWESNQADEKFKLILKILGHTIADNKGLILGVLGAIAATFVAYQTITGAVGGKKEEEEEKKKSIKSTA